MPRPVEGGPERERKPEPGVVAQPGGGLRDHRLAGQEHRTLLPQATEDGRHALVVTVVGSEQGQEGPGVDVRERHPERFGVP